MTRSTTAPSDRRGLRMRLDDDALDAILGADLAPELGASLGPAFDARRGRRLRARATWYFATLAVLALGRLTLDVVAVAGAGEESAWLRTTSLLAAVTALTVTASLAGWVRLRQPDRRRLVRVVTATIIVFGTLDILAGTFLAPGVGPGLAPDARTDAGMLPATALPFVVLAGVATTHLAACLFLPWTPRECLRPVAPLLVIFPCVTIPLGPWETGPAIVAALISPLAAAPGLLICGLRHGRERQRFLLSALQSEVRSSRRELATARGIHEAMLPAPIDRGPVRLHFAFDPVQDLGGDFLVVHPPAGATVPEAAPRTIVLLDVTGHGVTATLGATRLHAALEHALERRPDIGPRDLLLDANAACRRLLAPHAIFATAFAARLDPADGRLEWASAGHVPGLILRAGGDLVRLPATTTMLGVLDPPTFDPGSSQSILDRGDRLVLMTDGLVEARTATGRRLELEGFERLVRRAAGRRDVGPAGTGRFPARVLRAVDRYSDGPPEDDRVVIELTRSTAPPRATTHPA